MEKLNEKLQALYASKWQGLVTAMMPLLNDDNQDGIPACPLLLKIDDETAFQKADIRLMIFGQETNRWYESFHEDMAAITGYYDEFFNEGNCWNYGGQFWNGIRRFLDLLKQRHPDKTVYLVWNNLAKIGKDEGVGFPSDAIHEVEREHFGVIPHELDILKPTLALFLSGPNYDSVIQDVFGPIEITPVSEDFSVRQLAQFSIPNVGIALRTYHPGYLWRNNIDHYFDAVLNRFDSQLANYK